MITLYEHFEYSGSDGRYNLEPSEKSLLQKGPYRKTMKRQGEDALCYNIEFDEKQQEYKFCTSYFVGADWIIENKLSIYVQPKLNKEKTEINYLSMLFEAMREPINSEHLDGLFEIYFNKPQIEITQEQDILTPFLIVQYLQILKRIVQKGLKKTYYPIVQNLESKVKGKILINQTIKTNLVKNQITKTLCRYDEFGLNGEENKILKKALLFSQRAIYSYDDLIKNNDVIINLFNYINPAFETVSDNILIEKIKNFRPNPMYKEYGQALKLALLILKRFSYNITETENTKKLTPPFWIDMSKLFELYIFKKLREINTKNNEVIYHQKTHYQELDFLINSEDMKMVIDTKYKPRYENEKIYKIGRAHV
jgi:5-methylcytosine-specific restriction enzyme subunit McrC